MTPASISFNTCARDLALAHASDELRGNADVVLEALKSVEATKALAKSPAPRGHTRANCVGRVMRADEVNQRALHKFTTDFVSSTRVCIAEGYCFFFSHEN